MNQFYPKLTKPQLLKVSHGPAQSFSAHRQLTAHFDNKWHYHSELELISIKTGSGLLFAGDYTSPFCAGDVFLIGADLPHYFKFDESYFKEDCLQGVEVTAAYFSENFCGAQFLQLPENRMIKMMLEKAGRGIRLNGQPNIAVSTILERILVSEGASRILLLIEALNTISGIKDIDQLSSAGFCPGSEISADSRINTIYEYSYANFKNNIQLEEIAALANVCPSSFCRYFKSRTKKTYSQFLIEIKIGYACKLLIENNYVIKQLCYESGFNNFASFHKYFKLITGKSPLNFQREFMQQAS